MKLTLNNIPHHKGLTGSESLVIAENNRRIDNINALMDVDLEDISSEKLQMIREIIDGEYECPGCKEKEDIKEEVKDNIYDFLTEIKHELNVLKKDTFNSEDKYNREGWERFLKSWNRELSTMEKKLTKIIYEEGKECCFDANLP